jgi:hypothetical protein
MTKFLMTAAALILLSVSAHAGFKASPNYHPPDSVQLVCVPPLLKELDPVVRIHVGASFEDEKVETFSVVHETYLVKKYDRSDQYINAKLATKDRFLEWYWQGTEVRDINVSMIGRLYRNEQGWYYVEVLFRGRNVEFVMTAPCVAELSAGVVLGNRSESNF